MALTIDSKIGELLNDKEAAAIVTKYLPDFTTNPQVQLAKNMTLKVVAPLSGGKITPAILKAIEEDFKQL